MQIRKVILETFILLLILFWVYAGVTKLLDYDTYWRQVMLILGNETVSKTVAIILPLLQVAVAICLSFGISRKSALIASAVILSFFTGYIIYWLYFAPETPCSCTGIIPGFSWQQHLTFNTILLLINITGIVLAWEPVPQKRLTV